MLSEAPESFTLDGERFQKSPSTEFAGFYDWLRDTAGRLLGVKYYAQFESRDIVTTHICALRGCSIDANGVVTIRLRDGGDIDPEESDSKNFDDVAIYVSGRRIAFLFEVADLADTDIASLASLAATPRPAAEKPDRG